MKSLSIVVVVTSLIIGGCRRNAEPTGANSMPQLSISQVVDSISYTLNIPKSSFGTDDTLNSNESKTYTIEQAIKADSGNPVTPGQYSLSVFLRSANAPLLTLKITLS